jgi:hypothetical protein
MWYHIELAIRLSIGRKKGRRIAERDVLYDPFTGSQSPLVRSSLLD